MKMYYGTKVPHPVIMSLDQTKIDEHNVQFPEFQCSFIPFDGEYTLLSLSDKEVITPFVLTDHIFKFSNTQMAEDAWKSIIDIVIRTYLVVIPNFPEINLPTEFEFEWVII